MTYFLNLELAQENIPPGYFISFGITGCPFKITDFIKHIYYEGPCPVAPEAQCKCYY